RPLPATILAPRPFLWEKSGRSAGGRQFQQITTGESGSRTLVIGSVAGRDPAAIRLIDQLARELHENSLILGGFRADIIRTLNPDGEVNQSLTNEEHVPVYRSFPNVAPGTTPQQTLAPEVDFLLNRVRDSEPQRVIHVRSIGGSRGMIASSSPQSHAREVADWLDFKHSLLSQSAPKGSLEEMLITSSIDREVIMFGLPSTADPETVWEQYGDALMSLLK
ncbi:MAG: hypothetical protein KDA85_04050, partial [Planctomycetaceae bacterium]|nr:hypothetical protein [Planctomycetaceae bacterium]